MVAAESVQEQCCLSLSGLSVLSWALSLCFYASVIVPGRGSLAEFPLDPSIAVST